MQGLWGEVPEMSAPAVVYDGSGEAAREGGAPMSGMRGAGKLPSV